MPEKGPPDTSDDDAEPDLNENALALADPGDYHRNQRLKEIHQRRQKVGELIDEMDPVVQPKNHNRQQLQLARVVSAYIAEIEPLIDQTEHKPELPESMYWDNIEQFADNMGYKPREEREIPSYQESLKVYRVVNKFLAEIRPLIEEENEPLAV